MHDDKPKSSGGRDEGLNDWRTETDQWEDVDTEEWTEAENAYVHNEELRTLIERNRAHPERPRSRP